MENAYNIENVYTEKLQHSLEILSHIDYQDKSLMFYAEKVLMHIFILGTENCINDNANIRNICILILENIGKLEICLSRHVGSFLRSDYETVCMMRSALKFILENFSQIPIDWNETLDNFAYEINVKEFDEKLENYGPGYEDPNIEFDINIVKKVPKSHWWWRQI